MWLRVFFFQCRENFWDAAFLLIICGIYSPKWLAEPLKMNFCDFPIVQSTPPAFSLHFPRTYWYIRFKFQARLHFWMTSKPFLCDTCSFLCPACAHLIYIFHPPSVFVWLEKQSEEHFCATEGHDNLNWWAFLLCSTEAAHLLSHLE